MTKALLRTRDEAEAELERVVSRMKKIQRDISRTVHPASIMQIEELKKLGLEYARIVERLAELPDDTANA